jgi:cytochrome d ubiquinol oxidase subunit I
MLPTAVGVSSLSVTEVLLTLAGFVVLYSTLLVIEIALMIKYIKIGPDDGKPTDDQQPTVEQPVSGAATVPAE